MDKRRIEIRELYKSDKTLAEIGEIYGISRQRVSILLKTDGLGRAKKKHPDGKPISVADRFWSKVKIGNENECWEWIGAKANRAGYGKYRDTTAHRMAWKLTNGEIPTDRIICHKCDNKKCVNPNHLYAGSYSNNNQDAWDRGGHTRIWKKPSRFTDDIIREMVELKKAGWSYVSISKRYNTSGDYVRTLFKNKC